MNSVGVDMNKNTYEYKKRAEFEKYCIKAMKLAISDYKISGKNEGDFLYNLCFTLDYACGGVKYLHDNDDYSKKPNILVSQHYIKFASDVVQRRIDELKRNEGQVILQNCNYSSKGDLYKYVEILWSKYQTPWPKDWLKKDGI